jgi:hypothetical protein
MSDTLDQVQRGREEATRIQADYNMQVQRISADQDLSVEGRQRRLAELYAATEAKLTKSRDAEQVALAKSVRRARAQTVCSAEASRRRLSGPCCVGAGRFRPGCSGRDARGRTGTSPAGARDSRQRAGSDRNPEGDECRQHLERPLRQEVGSRARLLSRLESLSELGR